MSSYLISAVPYLVVRKDYDQSEIVLQIPAAIVIVGIAIALLGKDTEKAKAEFGYGFGSEETVMKQFDSVLDNVQARLLTFLNSKQSQLVVVKAQL